MTSGALAPAVLPPAGLHGLEQHWSRLVTAPDHTGKSRTWHLLDSHASSTIPARLTILCVHGNPSWSYLWRNVVRDAPPDVRVLAVDHLDMGFSERTATVRRLAHRVDDLCALTDHLGVDGPVVTLAHDWGGPISLGWAQRHLDQLAGAILTNTAVHQPEGSPAPALIRTARAPGMLAQVTVKTPTFVHGAIELSRPRLTKPVRDGLLAPYRTAARRHAIGVFVEDIPLDPSHPTHAPLAAIAAGLDDLADVPTLLLWGPSDPVFSDLYLHDFEERLPHADVHRFVGASHFVSEEADVVGAVYSWIDDLDSPQASSPRTKPSSRTSSSRTPSSRKPSSRKPSSRKPLWSELSRLQHSDLAAVVETHGQNTTTISFAELNRRVEAAAAGLAAHGVANGDRVALMIPPGIELTVMLYACWRIGAVMVLVDSGLGAKNMSRALRSANPAYLVGIKRAMRAARALRWPGQRICSEMLRAAERRALGVSITTGELEAEGHTVSLAAEGHTVSLAAEGHTVSLAAALPAPPADTDLAAIVFTSGSTGPSKGVRYRHHQVQAQRDLLRELYNITADDRLVAAFAPFALYGPALGITSAVPDMDVAQPGTLTAAALATTVAAIDATLVFASPAALQNTLETAATDPAATGTFDGVRLLLSAGAPVDTSLLRRAKRLFPNAEAHTPYGMTEVLPVADISLDELEELPIDTGDLGVCVGVPHPSVSVRIHAIDAHGTVSVEAATQPLVFGEVVVQAPHAKDGYDRLWYTDHQSTGTPDADGSTWHHTGDTGTLDASGRLWISGRIDHLLTPPNGPLGPVSLEHAATTVDGVHRAAAVGIGPVGTQALVVVIENPKAKRSMTEASPEIRDAVRTAVAQRLPASDLDIAAVVMQRTVPVDRRHNAKIDRTALRQAAAKLLAGE